jgi:hypothetical protein
MKPFWAEKIRAWLAGAIGLAVAVASVTALAQVTQEDTNEISRRQQIIGVVELLMTRMEKAQRDGDCGLYNHDRSFLESVELDNVNSAMFAGPEWIEEFRDRLSKAKTLGCREAHQPDGPSEHVDVYAAAPDPSIAEVALCPSQYNSSLEVTLGVCRCGPVGGGTVWGTRMYTSDSNICRAAVHAGAIPRTGGVVQVVLQFGLPKYEGSTQNGITTEDWGNWNASFKVQRATPPYPTARSLVLALPNYFQPAAGSIEACPARVQGNEAKLSQQPCRCPDGGKTYETVWGSGPYTADSPICRAARHAGAVGAGGGVVRVIVEGERASFQGNTRNGVTTQGWSSYPASFRFGPSPDQPAPAQEASQIDGVYDTSYGTMTLSRSGGSYTYEDGRIVFVRVADNIAEGTWEQSISDRKCVDGAYWGVIRFVFTDTGFDGTFGYCNDEPKGVWTGTRISSGAAD